MKKVNPAESSNQALDLFLGADNKIGYLTLGTIQISAII